MIKIKKLNVDYSYDYVVTDNLYPVITFYAESSRNKDSITQATLTINGHIIDVTNKVSYKYEFNDLKPLNKYNVTLKIKNSLGELDIKTTYFETGLLGFNFKGKWISDPKYVLKEKKISPKPLLFYKSFKLGDKKIKSAKLLSTALGIYKIKLNDTYVGEDYFAPGFTSYKFNLQYQVYDCTNLLKKDSNDIKVMVAGGWAVGSFVFTRTNKITAPRQALLLDLLIEYEDGTKEYVSTDSSWLVTSNTPFIEADLYDGEVYDGRFDTAQYKFHNACIENVKINPTLKASYGSMVKEHEIMKPTFLYKLDNKYIFDFKQNFAGIINLHVKNAKGDETITIKHAELLSANKDLNTAFLRTAKQTLVYYPPKGESYYKPTFTYMGFRYISIEGIDINNVEIDAIALYSDIKQIGYFKSSYELLNRLQDNIVWSLKSNFMDIPTDCPQRDERMGWTGDINVFAPTAIFNYDCTRFLNKWLEDVKVEQLKSGGIPNTIPSQGYGFPTTMPTVACEFWGDAIINVPYELYKATGDKYFLTNYYPSMQKYHKACKWWASFLSFGKKKYIWKTINLIHFGDWVAPDIDKMSSWQGRHPYTATASFKASSSTLSTISTILGKQEEANNYNDLARKISDAYETILLDKDGKEKKEEFQTGYVLPIYFDMLTTKKEQVIDNLVNLTKKYDYCVKTGFPGTPYILFALFDNGHQEDALRMLFNTKCPSWLYEVKVGGTTIWERWNGLDEDGTCSIKEDGTGGMISYNHYASGAVGAFLYQRLAGIEALDVGYKKFKVDPYLNSYLTSVEAKTTCMYGEIFVKYQIVYNKYRLEVKVPLLTTCELHLPNGQQRILSNGSYKFEIPL